MESLAIPINSVSTIRNMDSVGITNLIGSMVKDGISAGDIAVLGRNHFLLEKLSEAMTEAKIPHTYIGRKTALSNSEEFRRVHAFLKLMVNPYDNFSMLLIRELLGLSIAEFANIRVHASQNGMSHYQAWFDTHVELTPFGDILIAHKQYNLLSLLAEMGELQWPFETKAIFSFVREWEEKNPWQRDDCCIGTLQSYLKWLATYDIQEEVNEDNTGINLMTVHAAKGLEWPVVIIAGCNEGVLPSKQAIKDNDIEGERRLAYVAWTRAEKQLLLTVRPEKKEYQGKLFESPASRFIEESI
jgi:superfamily I DNA/RNA helicase